MSRWIPVVLLILSLGAVPASAQEPQASFARSFTFGAADVVHPADAPKPLDAARPSETAGAEPASALAPTPSPISFRPTPTLNALCVSFAALQVMDIGTTLRALNAGAREANPFMGGIASNKAVFFSMKAATTVGTIYFARKMGVRNRFATTMLMAGLNSAYAIIVAHNYRVGSVPR